MRIASRVAKLEQAYHAQMQRCIACGDIDPVTREGPFYPGILLDQPDGTTYCLCKLCFFSFRARLTPREDGGVWDRGVTPGSCVAFYSRREPARM